MDYYNKKLKVMCRWSNLKTKHISRSYTNTISFFQPKSNT